MARKEPEEGEKKQLFRDKFNALLHSHPKKAQERFADFTPAEVERLFPLLDRESKRILIPNFSKVEYIQEVFEHLIPEDVPLIDKRIVEGWRTHVKAEIMKDLANGAKSLRDDPKKDLYYAILDEETKKLLNI